MSSIEVLSVPNGEMPDSFDSSEFSLIPEQPEEETTMNFSHLDLSVVQSVAQDLSMEDVQKRLVELMADNESMKDALRLNNSMMKEQLKTITEWHTQMTTSMSKQQVNLSEAKDKLKCVEKENSELRSEIAKMLAESLIVENNETCKRDSLTNKLQSASGTITQLNEKLEKQTAMISELQNSVEEKEKTSLFLKEENEVLHQKCIDLVKQIKNGDEELHRAKSAHDTRQLELLNKIDALQKELLQAQQETEKERKLYNELKASNAVLETNKSKCVEKLEMMTNLNLEEMKRKKLLEQVDELTAGNFDLQQKLDKRVHDMRKLTEELMTAHMEAEVIPVLKAQVDEYKAELDNAILAKESAREEVERLKTSNETQAAAALFCSNCGSGNANSNSSSSENDPNQPSQASPGLIANYNCPICGFGFDNLQAAENHVNTCLDNSETVVSI